MKCSFAFALFLATTTVSTCLMAQQSAKSGILPPPPRGVARLHITPAPGQVPTTLKDLVDSSALIIEGTVTRILPARETSPGSLETDAIISVVKTVKGPHIAQQIAVAQRGGVTTTFSVVPAQYSLFQIGDSFLLFLIEDKRATAPDIGIARYLVTGIWSGQFHFQRGQLTLAVDEPDRLRSKYIGRTREQILEAVLATLRP